MKYLLLLAILLTACAGDSAESERTGSPEAFSLLGGEPLFPTQLSEEVQADRLVKLQEAKDAYLAHPDQELAVIWYGRRLGYLDRYSDAIEVYTKGLAKHPNSAKLLRHRGHRYISRRDFVAAIRDLSRAAELVDALEDEIEPDGIPNERNEPRSTLHFNIWYHLGLAYFFNGEFPQAYSAFGECYAIAKRNGDLLCAATHWFYVAARRIGLHADTQYLLDAITLDIDVIENKDYLDLVMFYKGHYTVEEVMDVTNPLQRATRGFGVAHYLLMNGETDRANDLFLEIVDEGLWPAFGAIAAEVELARL